MRHRLIYS